MTVCVQAPTTRFALPPDREATTPPERRGLARDGVRLLVARPDRLQHAVFRDLADHLEPGDLVVVNTSATVPAGLDVARVDGRMTAMHVATALDDGDWVVEVRRPDNSGPADDVAPGEVIVLPGGARAEVVSSFPRPEDGVGRLWRARVRRDGRPVPLRPYLSDHGRPIRYSYLADPPALGDLQTVYADRPGSAEMPSAGRPFTARLLVRLMARGISVAPVVLHTGVSSPEAHEPPMPERFEVSEATARLVNTARLAGRRVVAVGTTVTRALETVAAADGTVAPGAGWTDVVLGPDRPVRSVNGLISGLHVPQASHLLLLEAVAGPALVSAAYDEAVRRGYLWHEFGDSMLFLP
jgi:S-adenosylmethionine:tRNA ribosyltransferase-isomerase